jgi:hypothetical protein
VRRRGLVAIGAIVGLLLVLAFGLADLRSSSPALANRLPRDGKIIATFFSCPDVPNDPTLCAREWRTWIVDPHTGSGGPAECAEAGPRCEDVSPAYSARSHKLAIVNAGSVLTADRWGNNAQVVSTPFDLRVAGPVSWSPDGRRLLVPTMTRDLLIVDVEHGTAKKWRRGLSADWASSGRIAYRDRHRRLLVTDRHGRHPHRLLVSGGGTMRFSPDAKTLAYGCKHDRNICLLTLGKSQEHPLRRSVCDSTVPMPYAWSPDSRRLLCVGRRAAFLITRSSRRARNAHLGSRFTTRAGLQSITWTRR